MILPVMYSLTYVGYTCSSTKGLAAHTVPLRSLPATLTGCAKLFAEAKMSSRLLKKVGI